MINKYLGTNNRTEFQVIAILWIGLWLIINFSGWINTVGVFNTNDSSLTLPSIWGAIFNLILFLGNGVLLISRFLLKRQLGKYLISLFFLFGFTSSVDSLLDAAYYRHFYDVSTDYLEIWIGNVIIDCFFILIPSFLYRFGRDWYRTAGDKAIEINAPALQKTLSVKSGTSLYQISFEELQYLESEGNYIKLHTTSETIMARESLSKQMEFLPSETFVRCHKSFIVNRAYVKRITSDSVWIERAEIPIGRAFKENVRSFFLAK